jgi:type VI secretion system protein ImpH
MADDGRIAPNALTAGDFSAAATHDFYQLLRRFECRYRAAPRVGRALRLGQEVVRLGQEASLAFAAGPVASASQPTPGAAWRVLVHCFGMLGPNGPLPVHLTEYVRQRRKHHADTSLARFLDLFHHRMLSFFYRAWADAQPAVQHDRPDENRFSNYLASLMGLGTPGLRERDALPDAAKLLYVGRFAPQARNVEGLTALIEGYFGMPASIDEFIGEWAAIPERERWSLGLPADAPRFGRLGDSTRLGSQVWLRQSRFRLVLGPLGRAEFNRVARGGEPVAALAALVRGYVGDELGWELLLKLSHDALPNFRLGEAELGHTTWLHVASHAISDGRVFACRFQQRNA